MIEMYQNCDVFVFPSNQESFGQTLFESMSCGVIPISYYVGVAPELIDNSINGFLVDRLDKESLVSAFKQIMISDVVKLKLKAREKIEDKFNEEKILSDHIQLIHSIINKDLD